MVKKKADVKGMLIEQFALAHSKKYWFADLHSSLKGLNVKEAVWKPNETDHCTWEILSHIYYWNNRFLIFFKGKQQGEWIGNNDKTFAITSKISPGGLRSDLKKLETQTKEFEKWIRKCKPSRLNEPLSK